ncbi:ATP-dependent helicase HrpB [Cryobacterium zongtaii]|uniref:ATP-dependent helicase HrpB n=1 Tax=Cryobacterium zongtaii TaxID=1259217 RepID=A0A2S3ZI77_9MICO|nr:ATP-dependent helicase HrpB [Cryobacterium zongtaii]POH66881.1 ATP-dependent helicase HrpB [Cryobacterium zongtaii]
MTRLSFDPSRLGRGLAFASAIDDLSAALDRSRTVVVSAPPGTGKTTLVPPILADRVPGRVIVTQPRRVAARAAARRLAQLDGSSLGSRVGYTVRGERQVSPSTLIEFVTAGVLLRRLLDDPGLDGIDAVIIDEVHERALETDLLIGLLGEVRELRDDLVLIAMSATLDAERFASILGTDAGPAPIVTQSAPAHPLEVRWAPSPTPRLDERGVTWAFLDHVASTAVAAHRTLVRTDPAADALVFAPGAREVSEIAGRIRGLAAEFDVRELHGQIPAAEQDTVVSGRSPDAAARIIVTTSLAESSLTVPGVRLVVDTCLSRAPQRDAARGMSGLVTGPTPKASAIQRSGRATRQGPGVVVRCVDERTFATAPSHAAPEIQAADLTDAALLLACWGAPSGVGLRLLDPLPSGSLDEALAALRGLGAIDADGRATDEGRALARVPTAPRLARALRAGSDLVGGRTAAEVIALLTGDLRVHDGDAQATLNALRTGRSPDARRWEQDVRRLERFAGAIDTARGGADQTGLIIALAFPEWIARRVDQSPNGATFLLASGTRAGITGQLASADWLAVADVTRAEGRAAAGTGALIRSAAVISENQAEQVAPHLCTDRVEARFVDGRVVARRERRIGAIIRSSLPVRVPADDGGRDAVRRAVTAHGLGVFIWSDAADALRRRLALLYRELGSPWPDVSDTVLLATLDAWLGPELSDLAAGTPAARIDLAPALRRTLPWPAAVDLDALVPERFRVPSGSHVRLSYPPADDSSARPVVAVKLQECFGWAETPRIVGGRVPVLFHLLSPAGHPLAVTDDLASFWAGPYSQVRAEMRGRYPKHPWPEDPWSAVPTRHTTRRAALG